MQDNQVVSEMTKKVTAHDVVTVRPATGKEDPPMIVSIPRHIAERMDLKLRDKLRIYTDDEKIYLDKYEEPRIS